MKRAFHIILPLWLLLAFSACGLPRNFTQNFYNHNEATLESIKERYKALYRQHPFAVLFEEKKFQDLSFEFIEDTIKYIYPFNINGKALADSLAARKFNVDAVLKLIHDMREIQCTWISTVAYYENLRERSLIQMAVRNKALNSTFKGESYCILVFFETPQPFNEKGIFLDRADKKRRRQIYGNIIKKVNDRVGYTISRHYR